MHLLLWLGERCAAGLPPAASGGGTGGGLLLMGRLTPRLLVGGARREGEGELASQGVDETTQTSVNHIIMSTKHRRRLIEVWAESDLWLDSHNNQYQSI